jgi:hypothetical protein
MLEIICQHLAWYPRMELRDVYKLLYQAVMGSEHIISSVEAFSRYLEEELDVLQPDPTERLLEPIRPDLTLFRINLRPYKSLHLPLVSFIPLLVDTAHLFSGDHTQLQAAWINFVQSCEQGQIINFHANEVNQFTKWLEQIEFSAVHHSDAYTRLYQPAYRLISPTYFSTLRINYEG